MFCIIVRGVEGNEYWRMWRSVETLAYDPSEETVNILFLLYLENLRPDGQKNSLEVLHPGNTSYELLPVPWPFPWHVDEGQESGSGHATRENVLTSLYGRAFAKDDSGCLRHVYGLTPWDSWFDDLGQRPVSIWPAEELVQPNEAMRRKLFPTPLPDDEAFAPFTVFELGPFTRKGPTLLAFRLRLSGNSYRELVEGDKVFTVDGPETLLLRIARKYVPRTDDPQKWLSQLACFRTYVDIGESYDVILLQRGSSSQRIRTVRECGIVKAPLQLRQSRGTVRYVTANPRFCLSLAYAKKMETAKVRQAVGLVER